MVLRIIMFKPIVIIYLTALYKKWDEIDSKISEIEDKLRHNELYAKDFIEHDKKRLDMKYKEKSLMELLDNTFIPDITKEKAYQLIKESDFGSVENLVNLSKEILNEDAKDFEKELKENNYKIAIPVIKIARRLNEFYFEGLQKDYKKMKLQCS